MVTGGEPGDPVDEPGEIATEDIGDEFREGALGYIDDERHQADEGDARRRQRDGRADGGPDPRPLRRSTRSSSTGSRTATSPTTSRTRCSRRTAASSSTRCAETGADLGIAWDGDADRCFFIDDTGRFVDGDFLTALLAESILRKDPGADDPLRRARLARRARRRGGAPAARRTSTAWATRSSRRACASSARPSAARSRATTTSTTSTAPTPARIPALLILELLSVEGKKLSRAARAAPRRSTSSPARSTPRWRTRRAR